MTHLLEAFSRFCKGGGIISGCQTRIQFKSRKDIRLGKKMRWNREEEEWPQEERGEKGGGGEGMGRVTMHRTACDHYVFVRLKC